MSLRPSASSFQRSIMMAHVGCGDAAVAEAINKRIRTAYRDNLPLRVRAREIVEALVHRRGVAHRDEDEVFQIVVNELAQHGQTHDTCPGVFWEAFYGAIEAKRAQPSDGYLRQCLHGMLNGQPLFGQRNTSSWAFYACVRNEGAVLLRDFIATEPALQDLWDRETALAWLGAETAKGRDLWFWVS